MFKPRSRVAQEVKDKEKAASEIENKIKQLSNQISNPQKYFQPKPDEKNRSALEHFRRYFMVSRAGSIIKRKPTRAELRAERNRAIFWMVFALILGVFVLSHVLNLFKRFSTNKPAAVSKSER